MPIIASMYRAIRKRYVVYLQKFKKVENVFTEIYRRNKWKGKDSFSGPGSDTYQTRIVISELPTLINEFNIRTMIDIPCGDFHWMRSVDLNGIDYTGADVVKELIQKNIEKYSQDGLQFHSMNLIKDKLPRVDLVFCRDCLVHFCFADVFSALDNICKSQSEYLLTTTFTGRKDNYDIVTGKWRPLNLEVSPFSLPKALKVINEGCTEGDGAYSDKALGLWRIADIQDSLTFKD